MGERWCLRRSEQRPPESSENLRREVLRLRLVFRAMEWERLDVPVEVSVWRNASEGRIVAAAYVWSDGFEWCHAGHEQEAPAGPEELASRPSREDFPLFDDEKTQIVGPLGVARAFLRAVVSAGLIEPAGMTSTSWPGGDTDEIDVWPPIDLHSRFRPPTGSAVGCSGVVPSRRVASVGQVSKLQSRYRQEVLHAKAGEYGNYASLGSYLDADEVAAKPGLNFLSSVALAHAMERQVVVRKQGGSLNPLRLQLNLLSSFASTCSARCAQSPTSSAFFRSSLMPRPRRSGKSSASGRRSRHRPEVLGFVGCGAPARHARQRRPPQRR